MEGSITERIGKYPHSDRSIPSAATSVLLFAALVCCGAAASAPQDLPGTWNVIAELVTSSAENPSDPNATKPGTVRSDTWSIFDSSEGPILKGSAGSISGQYRDNGAAFEGTYPLGSGVYQVVRIECILSSSSAMYGTIENDYWGTNTVTGEMIKLGIESWKFRATKL